MKGVPLCRYISVARHFALRFQSSSLLVSPKRETTRGWSWLPRKSVFQSIAPCQAATMRLSFGTSRGMAFHLEPSPSMSMRSNWKSRSSSRPSPTRLLAFSVLTKEVSPTHMQSRPSKQRRRISRRYSCSLGWKAKCSGENT